MLWYREVLSCYVVWMNLVNLLMPTKSLGTNGLIKSDSLQVEVYLHGALQHPTVIEGFDTVLGPALNGGGGREGRERRGGGRLIEAWFSLHCFLVFFSGVSTGTEFLHSHKYGSCNTRRLVERDLADIRKSMLDDKVGLFVSRHY